MTLRQKQSLFVRKINLLINYAHEMGYELTFGDAARSQEEASRLGFPNSNHVRRLAVDFNLFRNGRYLTSTEAHKPLGEFWESLSTDEVECCWGGRFEDGNHYSFKHGNVR